ncbi:HrpT family type III secretion system protein [Pectobacterium peruviense]|uniref:Type III secretion protein HrpT n=1 Tax=Pectobacterium peruviense TaxID=2066479 RepID=A0ABX4SD51_9GAMM|nr:HrpT family type III secretion system protein [Pectobacterium peruviense]KML67166.1 type III secretion protein HrpT [Pectobacterium peruviense]PKX88029.1 type III secretion protein HrpT [Pectobacterium peruviense]
MNYKTWLVVLIAFLLSACNSPRQVANCASVTCRPQPETRQLIIWWQPDLRNGPADYSRVSVDE